MKLLKQDIELLANPMEKTGMQLLECICIDF